MFSQKRRLVARKNDAVLVVVDVQEKLFPVMQAKDALLKRLSILVRGMTQLGVPIVFTEQNRRGLGPTVAPLVAEAPGSTVIEKATFSCMGNEPFLDHLRGAGRSQVLLAGIEAHICVLQTALDLIESGYDVQIVTDAVSSRLVHTGPAGIDRALRAGAQPTTVESALFECLERCDTEAFKKMLPLVREGV